MIDYSTILTPILELWWLFPIIVIIIFLKSPIGKGIIGEGLLNFIINNTLEKEEYQLLKNITLQTEEGTTQIDHIIVSQYGLFVIETKNYKGWIFGSEHSKTWTQSIFGKKNTFQNPLHQNYKHVKVLQKLLNLDDTKIFSVVVFIGESTFKTSMPHNVVYPMGLLKFIKSQQNILLTYEEMYKIVEKIKNVQLAKGLKTNREHVQNLKTKLSKVPKKEKTSKIFYNDLECPWCGSELVVRVAKRGRYTGNEFYGCSSFPRCKYTKSVK